MARRSTIFRQHDLTGRMGAARAPGLEVSQREIPAKGEISDVASGHTDDAAYAGQILDGAKMITKYLVHLGFTDMTEKRVFNWAADGRLPVRKIGSRLITNKRTLLRHFGLDYW